MLKATSEFPPVNVEHTVTGSQLGPECLVSSCAASVCCCSSEPTWCILQAAFSTAQPKYSSRSSVDPWCPLPCSVMMVMRPPLGEAANVQGGAGVASVHSVLGSRWAGGPAAPGLFRWLNLPFLGRSSSQSDTIPRHLLLWKQIQEQVTLVSFSLRGGIQINETPRMITEQGQSVRRWPPLLLE